MTRVAYISKTQEKYLSDVQRYNISYYRIIRIVNFIYFLVTISLKKDDTEVIIGNSKIIEFRILSSITKFFPTKSFSYINDFYMDDFDDLQEARRKLKPYKIYLIGKSDEEVEQISKLMTQQLIVLTKKEPKTKTITNASVLSVKPFLQFPIIYFLDILKYIIFVMKNEDITVITYHPRVRKFERFLYKNLFPTAVEVEVSNFNFSDVKIFGFYSSFIFHSSYQKIELIKFTGHKPYEKFMEKIDM